MSKAVARGRADKLPRKKCPLCGLEVVVARSRGSDREVWLDPGISVTGEVVLADDEGTVELATAAQRGGGEAFERHLATCTAEVAQRVNR